MKRSSAQRRGEAERVVGKRPQRVRVNDVAELDRVVQGSLIRHAQQTRGRFEAHLRRLEVGSLILDSAIYNQRVSGFGGLSPKGITFGVFPAPPGSGNLNGFPLERGAWGFGDEGEIRGSLPAGLRWFSIFAERHALEERMEVLGVDPARLRALEGTPVAWPIDLARAESILHSLFDGPGLLAPDSAVEEDLIDALLGRSAGPSVVRSRALRRGVAALRRAEDHLRSVVDRPVSATELCRWAGCGRRQLETLFHEHYGVGPICFHRQLRMNLARRALQVKGTDRGAVTRIANAYGFTHLGRFAGAYRDLFGESPRATARSRGGGRSSQ